MFAGESIRIARRLRLLAAPPLSSAEKLSLTGEMFQGPGGSAAFSGLDFRDRRVSLLAAYASGADQIHGRAQVLRSLADDAEVKQAEYNAAFVLAEYFGYLRRDPDQAAMTLVQCFE